MNKKIEARVEKAGDLAYSYSYNGGHCSHCTIRALMETYDEVDNRIFRALGALAGGCGLEGDSGCGAYSAASYFFGMTYGLNLEDMNNQNPPLKNKGDNIYKLVKELHDRFIDKYGSIVCIQIHRKLFGRPFYLGNEEEHEKLKELIEKNKTKLEFKWCAHICRDAARWSVEIFEEFRSNQR